MDTPTLHPAATWALEQTLSATDVDCTTAVVLKILDGKCKMLPGEKAAVLTIYEVVRERSAPLFDAETHRHIDAARSGNGDGEAIHNLRLYAEARIPKPVMKAYKAKLRDGLFG